MSEIFDELRIIASDSKGLSGDDRKKLVEAANEYDRLAAAMKEQNRQFPQHPEPVNLNDFQRIEAAEGFCTQFVMTQTDTRFSIVCGNQKHHLKRDNIGVSMFAFEPAFVLMTSPQGAKDLVIMLTNQVEHYEERYGPVVTELSKRMGQIAPGRPQA